MTAGQTGSHMTQRGVESGRTGPLWALHHWLAHPKVEIDEARFELYAVNNWAMAIGVVAHASFLVLFLAIGAKELAWFNVGSVLLFVVALALSQRGRLIASLTLASVEVVAHAWIVTAWLGWGSGFHMHIALALELVVLFAWLSLARRIVAAIVLSASYAALVPASRYFEPVVDLQPDVELGLGVLNAAVFYSVTIGVLAYHTWTTEVTKRAREEAIARVRVREEELQIARDEALRARAQAEGGSEAKSLFLANMSHELRTPLNAIIGYSEMIGEDAEVDENTELLEEVGRIQGAGKHLLALINDILDLSKIEAGKMDVECIDFDFEVCVREVVATIEPLAERNGNTLDITMAPGLTRMKGDPTKVRQILFNLLSNACKFTEKGTVRLEAAPLAFEGREWVEVAVADTGIGMDGEALARVFDEFAQGDQSTTRRFGGTGLGLAITRRFCELLEGSIRVSSRLGEGSRFDVRLPRELKAPA